MANDDTALISEADIAVVGMACRFPAATSVADYWRNCRDGVECVEHYDDASLREAGVSAEMLRNPLYVKTGAPLPGMKLFDAEFFGFSPKDAAIMDPQHRHFLECAWEALEDAGHAPSTFDGSVGVFGGCGMNAYMMFNLLSNPALMESVGLFLIRHTGNDKDFLATRVSYNLNLTGPSINVQTACSTSLVAIHQAVQSLLGGECDLALAGGVTIEQPHRQGYLYKEGEILSPDGHCRAFDHRSQGTIFGSGVGIVVLRRLKDAMETGDHIHAVIKGSAINNDGSSKVGYLAPSVDGQAAAVAEALAVAGLSADAISYIECHGTGTPVGDPIEIAALTQAFRGSTERTGFCGIGSVKSNIGHLDTAAGVASFIKVAQALQHRQIPPTLNYEAPNPEIDFDDSPFYVNAELRDWVTDGAPRRAGVSSLGVGGTNAHIILQEAPGRPMSRPGKPWQVLTLSARNPAALDEATERLARHLEQHPDLNLADVAYTLQVGRHGFAHRRSVVCRGLADAIDALSGKDTSRRPMRKVSSSRPSVAFMFPGGGAQYLRMGLDLYEDEAVFREHVDRGLALFKSRSGIDLRPLWFAGEGDLERAGEALERPSLQLPALFIIEYALAQLWMSLGVKPAALLGHSMGENTAACVAGVMSFEDCLGLVALRGELFERIPKGGMLSVQLSKDELLPLLGDDLDLAAINSSGLCVASGPAPALARLETTLTERGVEVRRIKIDIAAHSAMLEPILKDFGAYLRKIELHHPQIPFVSNRTGTWITVEDATDPDYWVRHLRNTIHFADGVGTVLEEPGRILLEVGPGRILSSLARQHQAVTPGQVISSSLRHPDEQVSDTAFLLTVLGRLWSEGVPVDWAAYHGEEKRYRVPLPTYAFQRQEYWIAPGQPVQTVMPGGDVLEKMADLDDWIHVPAWTEKPLPSSPMSLGSPGDTWLLFLDAMGVGEALASRLRAGGAQVLTVREGDTFYRVSESEFALAPEEGREGYDALVASMAEADQIPDQVVHLWTLTADRRARPGSSFYHHVQERGFYSLLFLAQALGDQGLSRPLHLSVVSNGGQRVGDEKLLDPEKSTLTGPCRVIPREIPQVTCRAIDVVLPGPRRRFRRAGLSGTMEELVDLLSRELGEDAACATIAHRGTRRFVQEFHHHELPRLGAGKTKLKERGVYLITGGLGGLGLVFAEHLARRWKARLVLVARSRVPPRAEWERYLLTHSSRDATSRKLRRLIGIEAAGGEVMTVAADVADVNEMEEVLKAAKDRFGVINGVLHAAGNLDDDLLQLKTQTAIDDVFAPKIQGTLVLDQLLRGRDLDFMVLFSSTSSLLGAAGQIDYVAANAFLTAYAQSCVGSKRTHTVAVNWGVWNEVGMAVDAAGIDQEQDDEAAPAVEPVAHPLLDVCIARGRDEVVYESHYDSRTLWLLDEHRTRSGRAVIPGTGQIELLRAAFAESQGPGPMEISSLSFLSPLQVPDGESRNVRVVMKREKASWAVRIESQPAHGSPAARKEWQLHSQARVTRGPPSAPERTALALAEIEARCSKRRTEYDPQGLRTRQEEHLRFGPRWRCLRQMHWGDGEALAQLEIPQGFEADLDTFELHPAILDLATGFAMELVEGYQGDSLYVPLSYEQIRITAPLARRVYSHVIGAPENHADKDVATFEIVICDESGRVLVEVQRFTVKKIAADTAFALTESRATTSMAIDDPAGLSPAERVFRRTLRAGILPAEGVEVFERILASKAVPQVIVTSIDLPTLMAQVEAAAPSPPDPSAKFARPSLASNYVAPRNDVETGLVAIWQDLLGVDQIGVQDDFFELGGHSLIAVRLFGQIKKRFDVDYPISVLFEAPTIEKCAAKISDQLGDDGAGQASRKPTFKHLVPMHAGQDASKAPFFLVAGMFGNVLNLRHLAGIVGKDRPFYTIQARGLHGDEKPHDRFPDMAAAYLEELRMVQPEGPYYLGGFSGGGITAYEMCQQLKAAGEEVALLVFLDTPIAKRPQLSRKDKAIIHWQCIRRRGIGYVVDWVKRRIQWERDKRQKQQEAAARPFEFRSAEIAKAFYDALAHYDTKPFDGRVVLFRPKLDESHVLGPGRVVSHAREFVYHDNDWGRFVPRGVEVIEVPGDHDGMVLEPSVRVLAANLRHCIEEAERGVRVRPVEPVPVG